MDKYGALQIPAQVVSGTFPPVQSAGDPLVGYVADFIKSVLTASVTTAWQQASPPVAPTFPVVQRVLLTDPRVTEFNENWLPALYVFRSDSLEDQQIEWFAEDYRSAVSTIHVWWVLPNATQEKRVARFGFPNAIVKTIDAAIEAMRDPSWIVPGDSDPQAATFGSQLALFAGWHVFNLRRARRQDLKIQMLDSQPRTYELLALEFHCEELLSRDISGLPATEIKNTYQIPDLGTGLGPFVTGQDDLT